MSSDRRPRFTLVSAVYDVEAYLPDFIASIEAQSFPLDRVEIVMVDDGSTDASPRLLAEWAARRPGAVRVLTQANAGQGAARNAGLAVATGEWVSFPDPDDVLEPDYLARVDAFAAENPAVDMVATHRLLWFDDEGEPANTHPLRSLFQRDRVVDLADEPGYFHGSAPAAFFRSDRVRADGITFDTRIRPNFEDGHFTSCYLLGFAAPKVGFLRSARYHYRKRSTGTSTLGTSLAHPGRYTDVIEHGYLDVARRAREAHGEVPGWLKSFLAYELEGYYGRTDSGSAAGAPVGGPVAERMHELVGRLVREADLADTILHSSLPLRRTARYALAHGYADEPWQEPFVLIDQRDRRRKLVRATWYSSGTPAEIEYLVDGLPERPVHGKVRDLVYAGRPLLQQHIAWLPADRDLAVRRDGEAAELFFERPPVPRRSVTPRQVRWHLDQLDQANGPWPMSKLGQRARRLASEPKASERYRRAWVLMDRIHDAGDSGEILFRWLREHQPQVNAWFVLEKGTEDWKRLARSGHRDRLVAHDSLQWRLLMANAAHLISSHADDAVLAPAAILEFTRPSWQTTFLQHGVIKDDLSVWLNAKPIDTFVTSTVAERASIVEDHTPYVFTTREVVLTGLPRFDRLSAAAAAVRPEDRDLILVAPTWRQGLLPPTTPGTQQRELSAGALAGSEFLRQWSEYLGSPELRAAAGRHGVRVGFMPHPNLQPLLAHLELPDHVQRLTYTGDVQSVFARARALVTDFSSVAFNAAWLDRPVVYFQFDEDTVLGGGHVGRGGYFDYRRDGFGPVTTTASDAVRATVEALDHGPTPSAPYAERIVATFPDREGSCCARVFDAIRASGRRT
ncbi:MAG: bifunctional glycosyltransferase/CDP-glycerol:glycerophosphate glycerophosphotransferase [Marmoricola sp.]